MGHDTHSGERREGKRRKEKEKEKEKGKVKF